MTWAAAIHLHNNIATVALPPTHTGTHTHTASWHRVMVECAYMTDYTGVHTDINCLPHSHTGTPWLNVLTWLTTWTYMPVLDTHHHTLIRTRACTHTHTHASSRFNVLTRMTTCIKNARFFSLHTVSHCPHTNTHTASSDVLQCSSLCLSSKTNQTQLREAAITRPMNQ